MCKNYLQKFYDSGRRVWIYGRKSFYLWLYEEDVVRDVLNCKGRRKYEKGISLAKKIFREETLAQNLFHTRGGLCSQAGKANINY